jgi:hypothetical protein
LQVVATRISVERAHGLISRLPGRILRPKE